MFKRANTAYNPATINFSTVQEPPLYQDQCSIDQAEIHAHIYSRDAPNHDL